MYHIEQADNSASPIRYCEKNEEWRGFAGSYGIQTEFGKRAIKRIDGSYTNVMGLPMEKLSEMLKEMGIIKGA